MYNWFPGHSASQGIFCVPPTYGARKRKHTHTKAFIYTALCVRGYRVSLLNFAWNRRTGLESVYVVCMFSTNSLLIYNGVTLLSCVHLLLFAECFFLFLFAIFILIIFLLSFFSFSFCSAVLGSMNSAIEVKDTPSEDLSLDEDYLGKILFDVIVFICFVFSLFPMDCVTLFTIPNHFAKFSLFPICRC